jgi:hypothetical protein
LTKEELQKIIENVEQSFEKGLRIKIRVLGLRFYFGGVTIVTFILAYYLSQVAVSAAVANMLELSVGLDAVAIAIAAFGLALFGQVLSKDWGEREKQKAERLHFKKLKGTNSNAIALRALIRMRLALPKDISLKDARTANPDLFSEKELVRRLLE